MLFNNDSMFVVGSLIFIGVGLFTSYNYYIFTTNAGMHESLVNTNSLPNLDTSIQVDNLPSHGYVDAAVQTESKSLWQSFKDWLRDVFSVNSSDVGSFGHDGVDNWRNNLDSVQSVSLHNSESPLTSVASNSSLHQLVVPDDSISNISTVTDIVTAAAINYPHIITDPTVLAVWLG